MQRGQALLVVVLIMVVSLTVGLAVVSRTIVNLKNSTEEENSQRAFSAAEAGVERLLKSQGQEGITNIDLSNQSRIEEANIQPVNGTSFLANGGNNISQDDGLDVWLSTYSSDPSLIYSNPWSGNLNIYWGSPSDSCAPPSTAAALEVIVITGPKNNPQSTRYAFDPCSRGNNFNTAFAGGQVLGKTFSYSATINNINSGLLARIVPVYAGTPIAITGSVALPNQGFIITSVGSSGDTSRKINYFKGYPSVVDEFFPHVVFISK